MVLEDSINTPRIGLRIGLNFEGTFHFSHIPAVHLVDFLNMVHDPAIPLRCTNEHFFEHCKIDAGMIREAFVRQ